MTPQVSHDNLGFIFSCTFRGFGVFWGAFLHAVAAGPLMAHLSEAEESWCLPLPLLYPGFCVEFVTFLVVFYFCYTEQHLTT